MHLAQRRGGRGETGLFEDWKDYIGAKRGGGGGGATNFEHVQITAATAAAQIDAARGLYLPGIREVMRMLGRGDKPTRIEELTARRNNSYACQLALSATGASRRATCRPAMCSRSSSTASACCRTASSWSTDRPAAGGPLRPPASDMQGRKPCRSTGFTRMWSLSVPARRA